MDIRDPPRVTGIVLAGGQGRRMGGVDKGLQLLRGRPMVAWVIERFAPQVDEILINANQNLDDYARFGHRVVRDAIGGFAGPLAGLHAGLKANAHPLVVTVPCDSPFLPLDLVARLHAALVAAHADLAVAKTGDQPHPVFSLVRASRCCAPHAVPRGGRAQDRRLVRDAEGGRGDRSTTRRSVPQHQHARDGD